MDAYACASPCPYTALDLARSRVQKLKRRIAKAQREGRFGRAKALSRLLEHSHSARVLAAGQALEHRQAARDEWDTLLHTLTSKKAGARNGRLARNARECLEGIAALPFSACGDIEEWMSRILERGDLFALRFELVRAADRKACPFPISLDVLFSRWEGTAYSHGGTVAFSARDAATLEAARREAGIMLRRRGFDMANDAICALRRGVDVGDVCVRRAGRALRTGPSAAASARFREGLRAIVHDCRGRSQRTLILRLNDFMRGWGLAQRPSCGLAPYRRLRDHVRRALLRWARRRYRKKGAHWRKARLWHRWGQGRCFSTAAPRADIRAVRLLDLVQDVIKHRSIRRVPVPTGCMPELCGA